MFLKSPPWNPLLADLITATLFLLKFFFSQGSVLFIVPNSKQPLPCGAKQATYTTHSWDFRPRHRRPPPPNTHNCLTSGSVTAVGVSGRAQSTFCDGPGPAPRTAGPVGGNPGVRECRARPGRPSVMDPSSITDGRSEFIYKILSKWQD